MLAQDNLIESRQSRAAFPLIALALCALVGAVLFYLATPYGLTISSGDGLVYIVGGKSIRAGLGYTYEGKPITHFPPLYSAALGAASVVIPDIWSAARWLHLALFAVTVFGSGVLAWWLSRENKTASVLVALIVASHPSLLGIETNVLSESLFVAVALCGQLALVIALSRRSLGLLAAAGLCFGLSALTRYSGVVWIASGALSALFWFDGRTLVRRLIGATVTGLAAVLPVLALAVRNRLSAGTTSNRSLGFHPVSKDHWTEFFSSVSGWVLPDRFYTWQAGVVVFAILVGLLALAARALMRRTGEGENGAEQWVQPRFVFGTSMVFVVLYLIHLPLAITFLHFNTPMDTRLLIPALVPLLILAPVACINLPSESLRSRLAQRCLAGVGVAFVLLSLTRTHHLIQFNRTVGRGFRNPVFQNCELIKAIRAVPVSTVLYSNKSEAILGALDRMALKVPYKENEMTLQPNLLLAEEMGEMKARLKSRNALLVYIFQEGLQAPPAVEKLVLSRRHQFNESELKELLPLKPILRTKDGAIYKLDENSGRNASQSTANRQ